jgi:hypothetical protein
MEKDCTFGDQLEGLAMLQATKIRTDEGFAIAKAQVIGNADFTRAGPAEQLTALAPGHAEGASAGSRPSRNHVHPTRRPTAQGSMQRIAAQGLGAVQVTAVTLAVGCPNFRAPQHE